MSLPGSHTATQAYIVSPGKWLSLPSSLPSSTAFILKDAVQRRVQVLPGGRHFTQTFPRRPSLFGARLFQSQKKKPKAEFRTMMEGWRATTVAAAPSFGCLEECSG